MEIRILRKQGKSLQAIAQEVGVSVNTVRKYLADDRAPLPVPAAQGEQARAVHALSARADRSGAAALGTGHGAVAGGAPTRHCVRSLKSCGLS